MGLAEQWQLSGSGPECYERFAVGRHLLPVAQEFIRRAPVREQDDVLDAACGTGIVARLLCQRSPHPRRVTGLDLNEGGSCQASCRVSCSIQAAFVATPGSWV
jgi:ubiquinone/menaquinone biosynthesis C-methylase UbiE